jgi:mRNA-degrading endonuclease RelE of RelBE toxin-antitoxin system
VSWRVFIRAAAESDLEGLSEADQQAVTTEMFAWVDQGPPLQTRREVLGIEMFDDSLPGGFRITYVTDEQNGQIFVLRILKSL